MQTAKQTLSPEAYLFMERASLDKHEYLYETVIPMAGASRIHNIIAGNLFALLWAFLRKSEAVVFQNDMRVYNPLNDSYIYPDVVISDGKPIVSDVFKDNLLNPLVIIEILSPSTALHDKTDKFIACRSMPTLKEYILISPEIRQTEIYQKDDEGHWTVQSFLPDAMLQITAISFSCELQDIYEKV